MCGIAGVYHANQSTFEWQAVLRDMVGCLKHRGPDEEGFFSDDDVCMGIRRLRVIDLETGAQPVSNETGSIQVIGNAEIYRYEDIRKQLQAKGHTFRSKCDIEVVVHLYEEYELDFFDHMDGMFAIALWDKERRRLLVARDRFGIKPLFYTVPTSLGCFAFASELSSLLRIPGITNELDPVGIDQFFQLSYIPHPRTAYRELRKLPPGSYLCVENDRVEINRYWNLASAATQLKQTDILDAVDSAISASVGTMMRADVPIGAFLSGGLDSATIVYHMAQQSTQAVRTFSVRHDESEFDEGRQILDVTKQLNTEHREIWCRPEDARYVAETQSYFGEPFADPSQIPTFLVSRLAREDVVVALTGDGGDELFGGYLTYVASILADKTSMLPTAFINGLSLVTGLLPSSSGRAGVEYKLQKFIQGCHLPPLERHVMWRTIFSEIQRHNLYSEEFTALLGAETREEAIGEWQVFLNMSSDDRLRGYQFLDIMTYLTDNNLAKWDRMSMANSLEVRVPLLDLDVFRVSCQVPAKLRINRGQTKIILRQLMKNRLPDSVTRMSKKGFSIPLSSWFRRELKPYVQEVLSRQRLEATGIANPDVVQEIIRSHFARRYNHSRQIWSLISFVHWHEQHL